MEESYLTAIPYYCFHHCTYYVNIRKYYYFLRKLLVCDCAPLYMTRSRLTKNLLQNGAYAKSESHIEGGQNRKYNSSTRDNTIVVYRYGDGWNLEIVTIICTPRGMKNAKNFLKNSTCITVAHPYPSKNTPSIVCFNKGNIFYHWEVLPNAIYANISDFLYSYDTLHGYCVFFRLWRF